MSTRVARADLTESRPRTPRVKRSVGSAAGLLALSLVVYSVAGAVWGALRPTFGAEVSTDGALLLHDVDNAQFTSFITFALITGLLGLVGALFAYFRFRGERGMGMLLWVAAVAFLAAISFWAVGEVVADRLHPVPEPSELKLGDELRVVPSLVPGIGAGAAPALASLGYWLAAVLDFLAPEPAKE